MKVLLFLCFLVGAVFAGDHYFQYANIPSKGHYEFGYNRGNPHHFTSRFEKAAGWTFKTKVRWGDKNGWGESYWDYNHKDKGWGKGDEHKGWGHKGHGHGGHQGGAFSEKVEQRVRPVGGYYDNSYEQQGQGRPAKRSYVDEQRPKLRYDDEYY